MSIPPLAHALLQVAREAGATIMAHYAQGVAREEKADRSPVTIADREAEALILNRLKDLAPQIPVISEEAAAEGHWPQVKDRFFLVDPLDGTKEFLNRNGEFTVNIALSEQGSLTLGVVFAPAIARMFLGVAGLGAFEVSPDGNTHKSIRARPLPVSGRIAMISRSHNNDRTREKLLGLGVGQTRIAGSSLKFCLIAAGEADLYPRFGDTMEWDTAAGQAVLEAAGGTVTLSDGATPLRYGKADMGFRNPHFIAWGAR